MKFKIGNKTVGDNAPCYLIAEIGLNHNGDRETAMRLIEEAARVGADAVKFQKRNTRAILIREFLDRPYAGENSYGKTYGEHREALELNDDVWYEIRDLSNRLGLGFFASPWDIDSADFLEQVGMPAYKIASADVTNLPLVKHVAAKGKPIIISSGMSTMEEVDEATSVITRVNNEVALLHCVSTYPCEDENVNLRMITTLRNQFPQIVIGYSGHEKSGHIVSQAAATLGAKIVERHFTLDRTMKGPDHAASLEPHGFGFLVEGIRKVECAMGSGEKLIQYEEIPIREKLAKSIVALCDITVGTVITPAMLTVKSPGTGIPANLINQVVGRKAMAEVQSDTLIPEEAIGWPQG